MYSLTFEGKVLVSMLYAIFLFHWGLLIYNQLKETYQVDIRIYTYNSKKKRITFQVYSNGIKASLLDKSIHRLW